VGVVGVYWSRSWRVSERECSLDERSLDERSVGEDLWEVPEMGSRSEAVELFEALLDRASPLGLYGVEMHPATVTEELGQRLMYGVSPQPDKHPRTRRAAGTVTRP
jgi:hypothetical protein